MACIWRSSAAVVQCARGDTSFIYDHGGERKLKTQSSPVIYPNAYYTDFGGGSGNQFKHIFIGSERILTKNARIALDRQHWYYHTDHLHSTGTVTNENSQMVDHPLLPVRRGVA